MTTTEALRLAREALTWMHDMAEGGKAVDHLYDGDCPDQLDRTRRDPACPACKAMDKARAALSAIDQAQAAPVGAPSVEPVAPAEYLFVQMDDDHRAWHRWCADVAEVREAVKAAMFFVSVGEELSAEHIDQLDASVDVLLEDGRLTFEGDPPLHLYRMGSAAWQKAATPQAQPATPPAVQAPAPLTDEQIAWCIFEARKEAGPLLRNGTLSYCIARLAVAEFCRINGIGAEAQGDAQ